MMSLIKVAFNPFAFISPTIGYRAAKSGDPLKYLLTRTNNPAVRRAQKGLLATAGHLEANIRKGMVQDSTTIGGAILDGAVLGHSGKLGGKALESIHHGKGIQAQTGRQALKYIINDNGTYNIGHIEKTLNLGKKAHKGLNIVSKIPTTTIGALGGAGIGYASGDKDHKLKSTLKGGLIGGALGGSISKGVKFFNPLFSKVNDLHGEYFKDNYWKSQLLEANSENYQDLGKFMAGKLTSNPADRAFRIARFEKQREYTDKFWQKANKFGSRLLSPESNPKHNPRMSNNY